MNIDLQSMFTADISSPVICYIIEDEYPVLFFSLLQRKLYPNALHIDVAEQQENIIQAQLETSFLGMARTYRLGGMHTLSKQAAQQKLHYVTGYQGPNRIICVVTQESAEPYKKTDYAYCSFIDIPAHMQKSLFLSLYAYAGGTKPSALERRFIDQLYLKVDKIPLDTACLMLHYMQVIGSSSADFFTEWLHKLVVPDASLFVLSQYFFAKQAGQFLEMWTTIKNTYPEQFWITYWSEQIWRALFYCKSMQQRDVLQAKKIGYRLPFSFLQKDFRSCNIKALQQAHKQLYELDVHLKNGGSSIGLDCFLLDYFAM